MIELSIMLVKFVCLLVGYGLMHAEAGSTGHFLRTDYMSRVPLEYQQIGLLSWPHSLLQRLLRCSGMSVFLHVSCGPLFNGAGAQ
jgi:hypothetical protein